MSIIKELRNGEQCDDDGVLWVVSRQACHEAAEQLEVNQVRIAKLEKALMSVREDICTGPIDDTLWRGKDRMSAETTVDFICNTLSDDWDYTEWLEAAALEKKYIGSGL